MLYDDRHNEVRRVGTTITADDGRELAATWFEPTGPAVGAVLMAPAMATPAAYYAAFATWLAANGYRTLTFDLRGTESVAAMKAERGDVLRWFGDMADALDTVLDDTVLDDTVLDPGLDPGLAAEGLPVTYIGHSLGGQAVPFVDHSRIDRIVTVASGTGYWRLNTPSIRWRAPLLWLGIAPVATRIAGYYPGRALRILDNVPANVMRQWGRWCLHRDYLGVDVPRAAERFASVTTPMTVLSFTDDELMTGASIADLHDRFVNADQVRQRYSPAQLEVGRMGHHGFFRARHQALWDELVLPYLAR
jgi:predicted alpha/beta hydrolase